MNEKLEDLLVFCEAQHRVCPVPPYWVQFWEMLLAQDASAKSLPPLVLAAWWDTSDTDKKTVFLRHVHIAAETGVLAKAGAFLRSLGPELWHHEGQ